ncbi:MAG: ATP-binding protein [Bacteroidia bacterium]
MLQIITKDVTERVKEKNLNAKLLDELSRKNNDLMQFSYIVSHNIRAPIAQILGLCYLIKMPNINDSERNKIIDLFSESANNIDALIKDLNNILTAKVPLNENKEKISIPSLLINIKELLKKQIEETKADIQIDIQKNSEEIYTLKRYLESILFNLISNSIKHKSPERNPVIRINVAKKSHTIITISDNGLGIDMKLYGDQVFGLYKRFNLSKEGKGLGLHMTKLQVEAMNGRITLKSKLDVGTVVRIELPK